MAFPAPTMSIRFRRPRSLTRIGNEVRHDRAEHFQGVSVSMPTHACQDVNVVMCDWKRQASNAARGLAQLDLMEYWKGDDTTCALFPSIVPGSRHHLHTAQCLVSGGTSYASVYGALRGLYIQFFFITWETVSRSGTAKTSSTGTALVWFQASQPSCLVCLLVTQLDDLSLCIWKCVIMKFHW